MATETYVMRGPKPVIKKDPNAILDYTANFTAWLAEISDSIVAATVAQVTGGLVVESVSFTANTVTAWLSGGVPTLPGGAYASATFRVTTVGGRTDDRTIYFRVLER